MSSTMLTIFPGTAKHIVFTSVLVSSGSKTNDAQAAETEAGNSGYPGERRRDRVECRHEICNDEKWKTVPSKGGFRLFVVGVRVSRKTVYEMQNPVALTPASFVPRPKHRLRQRE